MPIDIQNYTVVYEHKTYENCLELRNEIGIEDEDKPYVLNCEICLINARGKIEIIRDKADKFWFIPK